MLTPLGLRVRCSLVSNKIRTNQIKTHLGKRPMTLVMLKFYFRAASSQSASFISLSVGQWQDSAFSTWRMKSHVPYACESCWFIDGGLDQETVPSGKTPLHQPLSLLPAALTHPSQASEQVHLPPSDSWEAQLVPSPPCDFSPSTPHCKLPAFCCVQRGRQLPPSRWLQHAHTKEE